MASSSMNLSMSSAKVALSVKPLLFTSAAVGEFTTGEPKPDGASLDWATPTMASAAASAIKHSKKGMFRLVICEFLLDFRKCRFRLRTQPYCRQLLLGVCQEWTGKIRCCPSAIAASGMEPKWRARKYSNAGIVSNHNESFLIEVT